MSQQKSIWVLSRSIAFGRPVGLRHHEGKTAVFTTNDLAVEYADQKAISGYTAVEMKEPDSIIQIGSNYILNPTRREIIRQRTGDMVFHHFVDKAQAEYFHGQVKRLKGCESRYLFGHVAPLSEPGLFPLQSPVVWIVNPSPEIAATIQELFLKSGGEFYY